MAIQPIRIVISGIDKFSSTIGAAQKKIKGMADGVGDFGKKMAVGITLPLSVLAGTSLTTAATFEDSLNRVGILTGATSEQLASMSKTATDMGANTIFSATESAGAMKLMAEAGFKANEVLTGLPSVLKLSAIAGLEMSQAVNLADDVLETFHLDVNSLPIVVDKFATAAKLGGIGVGQLSESITSISPVAQAFGLNMDEVLTVLSRFGNLGVDMGRATNALRTGLSSLEKPSTEAVKIFEKLNIRKSDVFDDNGKLKSLTGFMQLLQQRGAKASDVIKIFGARSGPMLATFMEQGMSGIDDLQAKIQSFGGTADELMKKQSESFSGRVKKFKAVFQNFQIAIGNVLIPILVPLLEKASALVKVFDTFSPAVKRTIVVVAGLLALLGPMLAFLSPIVTAVVSLGTAIASAGGVVALLSNPIGWVIAGIAALVATITFMATHLQSKAGKMLTFFFPMGGIVAWIITRWSRLLPFIKLVFFGIVWLLKKFVSIAQPIIQPFIDMFAFFGGTLLKTLDFALSMVERLAQIALPEWLQKKIGLVTGENVGAQSREVGGLERALGGVYNNENSTHITIEDRAGVAIKSNTDKGTVSTEVLRGLALQGAY